MEIESGDEETLRKLAGGDTMDYSTWPLLLTTVLSRIDKIAHNDFPIPRIPQHNTTAPPPPEPRFLAPLPPSSDAADPPPSAADADAEPAAASGSNNSSDASSQETNKENAAPPDQQPQPQPSASSPAPEVPQPALLELEHGTLPPQITAMLAEITGILSETFHTYPPHTIQRLAELVLEPRRHYRSLPAYLHAVDRVVHVTSGNNIYPLPPAIPDMSHMSINGLVDGPEGNGAGNGESESGQAIWASSSNGAPIGSDEALGGALLTPIPWLARRPANGDGGSESGESSTLGSEGGPSPLGPAAATGTGQGQGQQRQSQSRQFEMQVRTESTETIDGPNGMGSIETVSVVNGISSLSPAQQQRVITQGELIRQEQRAGVVPVSQLTRTGPVVVTSSSGGGASTAASAEVGADTTMSEDEATATEQRKGEGEALKHNSSEKPDEDMADEETPHARGPDIIGAADMGPQTPSSSTFSISSAGNVEVRGIDVEAAVGRKHEDQVPRAEGQGEGDAAAVLTPASSEPEEVVAAVAEQGMTKSEEDASSKGESKEEDKEADDKKREPPETMDAEPSPAAMTASSSPAPGKREAEDDIAETDSASSKRLKGSPEKDGAGVRAEAEASSTAPDDAHAEPRDKGEQNEAQLKEDSEGDIVLSDQTAETETVAAGSAEPADGIGTEKKEEEGAQADGAKPAEESAD